MRLFRILAGLGLLVGSLSFAAPVAAGDPCYHGFEMPTRTDGPETQVKMMPCAFSPTVVRVEPGATVTWFNDLDTHLLTGANQEWGSRDDEVGPRETVAYRFDRPGTYPYACALHRGMVGAVIVGDGPSTAVPAGAAPAVVAISAPAPSPTVSAAAALAGSVPPAPDAGELAGTTTDPLPTASRDEFPSLAVAMVGLVVLGLGVVVGVIGSRRSAKHRATTG